MSPSREASFSTATRQRRSIRNLQATSPIADSAIIDFVTQALLHVPSAFNSQTTRMSVLFGAHHQKLWSIAAGSLIAKIGKTRYEKDFAHKIKNYAAAYGTILFWDDMSAIELTCANAPDIYKDKMEEWAHQSNGMHQYYLWTALEMQGLGANLQHYNPLIDQEVRETWNLPHEWQLVAQLVFGDPTADATPGPKVQKLPLEQRLTVHGQKPGQQRESS